MIEQSICAVWKVKLLLKLIKLDEDIKEFCKRLDNSVFSQSIKEHLDGPLRLQANKSIFD